MSDQFKSFAAAATATSVAEVFTIPVDTAKVRLQVQKNSSKYSGMFGTMKTVAKEEGFSALWKGITPGIHRQCLFGGLRIGMYDPIKQLFVGADHTGPVPLHLKIAASLTTGAGAIAIANPTDLVKIRMQMQGKQPSGVPLKYSSALGAYRTIVQEEGLRTLWIGVGPNMLRNSVMNAAELATYDQVKEQILSKGLLKDGVPCQLASSLSAGFVAVCIGSPVDVVKSRMMGSSAFSNPIDCFAQTFKHEGISAFYKGFIPNFGRVGSWNVVMFLTLEQVRAAMGI